MKVTLTLLLKGLKGEIGMNDQLDAIAFSLYNNFLPKAWADKAPQTEKSLGDWMQALFKRDQQYIDWIKKGEPKCIWISGLHYPGAYMTALIQTCCRAQGWPLDKSITYTVVTKMTDPAEIKKRPTFGCYMYGLYLEGARWNLDKGCLERQRPKELIYEMPIIQLIPIESNRLKLRDSLSTPCYCTQARRNAMGVGWVFDANLHTEEHPSHWILQGVCLTLRIK